MINFQPRQLLTRALLGALFVAATMGGGIAVPSTATAAASAPMCPAPVPFDADVAQAWLADPDASVEQMRALAGMTFAARPDKSGDPDRWIWINAFTLIHQRHLDVPSDKTAADAYAKARQALIDTWSNKSFIANAMNLYDLTQATETLFKKGLPSLTTLAKWVMKVRKMASENQAVTGLMHAMNDDARLTEFAAAVASVPDLVLAAEATPDLAETAVYDVPPPLNVTNDTSKRTTSAAFNTDGSLLAYVSSPKTQPGSPPAKAQLYVRNMQSGRTVNLTSAVGGSDLDASLILSPSFSPNSRVLAFTANPGRLTGARGHAAGNGALGAYYLRLTSAVLTGKARPTITRADATNGPDPTLGAEVRPFLSFSPNSDRLLFVSPTRFTNATPPGSNMFIHKLSTKALSEVPVALGPSTKSDIDEAQWSPDGKRIAFTTTAPLSEADTNGTRDIYVWLPTKKRLQLVTLAVTGSASDSGSGSLAWSPKGALGFTSTATNLAEIEGSRFQGRFQRYYRATFHDTPPLNGHAGRLDATTAPSITFLADNIYGNRLLFPDSEETVTLVGDRSQGVHRIPAAVQPFYDSYPVLTEHLPGSTNTQAFHELVAVAKTWIPGIRISDNTTTSTPGQVFAVISNHPLRGQPLDTTSLQLWLVSTTNDDLVQQCRTP